jgi:hypothetical protein
LGQLPILNLWVRLRAEPAGTTATLAYGSLRAPIGASWASLPTPEPRVRALLDFAAMRDVQILYCSA